jgi:hypothetical protein
MDDNSFDRDMSVACPYDRKLGWLWEKGAMARAVIYGGKHMKSDVEKKRLLITVKGGNRCECAHNGNNRITCGKINRDENAHKLNNRSGESILLCKAKRKQYTNGVNRNAWITSYIVEAWITLPGVSRRQANATVFLDFPHEGCG